MARRVSRRAFLRGAAATVGVGVGSLGVWRLLTPEDNTPIVLDGGRITATTDAGSATTTSSRAPAPGTSAPPESSTTSAGVEPPPTTIAASAANAPFGSRTRSGPIILEGKRNVTIENWHIADLPFTGGRDPHIGIQLINCTGVVIRNVDFENVAEGMHFEKCEDVRVENARALNITGPNHDPPQGHRFHVGNFVQADSCKWIDLIGLRGTGGDTEDAISFFKTGGTPERPCLIEDFHWEGTDWVGTAGSGIMTGDRGGEYIDVVRARLLNPGQVGIGIASGHHIRIIDPVILKPKNRQGGKGDVGISVHNFSRDLDVPCHSHEITGARVRWWTADNNENPIWDSGACLGGSESDNDFHADLNESDLQVVL